MWVRYLCLCVTGTILLQTAGDFSLCGIPDGSIIRPGRSVGLYTKNWPYRTILEPSPFQLERTLLDYVRTLRIQYIHSLNVL